MNADTAYILAKGAKVGFKPHFWQPWIVTETARRMLGYAGYGDYIRITLGALGHEHWCPIDKLEIWPGTG